MYRLFRRPVIYSVILLLLVILYMYVMSENQSTESTNIPKYLNRDYVLFDDGRKELQTTMTRDISRRQNKINILEQPKDNYADVHTQNVYLKTLNGKTQIFVHEAKDDNMISAYIRDYGTWEEDLLNQTAKILLHHPGISFLDIGCNIGVYTLFAASIGIKVISVDPIARNLKLLSRSLAAGNFVKNVTLILNAMADEYKTVSINIPKDNIGGAHIVDANKKDSNENMVEAETILLDDLIPYVKGEEVFIKMDVEGYEWNVLKGGRSLFQTKNVKAVLMEWVHHRHQKNGQLIVDHLMKNGLLPYTDASMTQILDPDGYYMWPENIFWIKR